MLDCQPQIHLAAIHAQAGYRGDTHGISAFCRAADGALIAGAGFYRNSIGKHSNYASVGWQPLTMAGVKLGAFASVVNGYDYKDGNYFLAGGLLASVPLRAGYLHDLHLHILPPASKGTAQSPLAVGLSVSVKF